MQAQPTDFDGKKLQSSTQGNATVKVTGEAKDKTNVSEEIYVADPGGIIGPEEDIDGLVDTRVFEGL